MMQLCFRLANLALPVEKAAVQRQKGRGRNVPTAGRNLEAHKVDETRIRTVKKRPLPRHLKDRYGRRRKAIGSVHQGIVVRVGARKL